MKIIITFTEIDNINILSLIKKTFKEFSRFYTFQNFLDSILHFSSKLNIEV